MLERRLRTLHALRHARRVADRELLGQELHRRPWHVQRILEEAAHGPRRAQLDRETQTMLIRSAPGDQISIGVIEVEEALYVPADNSPANRPYAATCSSDRNSTGMNHDRRPGTVPAQERQPDKINLTANHCSVVPQPRVQGPARRGRVRAGGGFAVPIQSLFFDGAVRLGEGGSGSCSGEGGGDGFGGRERGLLVGR